MCGGGEDGDGLLDIVSCIVSVVSMISLVTTSLRRLVRPAATLQHQLCSVFASHTDAVTDLQSFQLEMLDAVYLGDLIL